jgi:pyruvate dehydrogenase E2 component (dihydrolipoamide acetyltransferase)
MKNHGKTSVRKKIQASSWGNPSDPSCYGNLELNCEKIDSFIDAYNKKNPTNKITYTHFFVRLLGISLMKAPKANGMMAFGQFVPYKDIKISTLVSIDNKNLASVIIDEVNKKSLIEIQNLINSKVKKIKSKKDADTNEQMKVLNSIPTAFVSLFLELSAFITYYLGLSFKVLKLKKYAFGNIVLTNVSSMEIYNTFAPLVNFSNTTLCVVLCKPKVKPVVDEKGDIVSRKMINMNITFDHRYADASMVNLALKEIYRLVENPNEMLI